MKRFDMRIIFGLVLIAAGILFMLENIGIFQVGAGLVWAMILGGAGLTSLYVFAINRDNWWALIPGCTLTAIGASIGLGVIAPALENIFGGAMILGGIGLSFWLVYFVNRQFWWALIPAGVLTSLAAISTLDNLFPRFDTGGLLMLGLGSTFILLGVLPGYGNSLKWAFIPGGILTLIGFISLPFVGNVFSTLWPVALIATGGYVIYRNFKRE